ncbi:MAG: iron-containing alcohol dehydrogenase [Defluviitaleaceae bacterium]|nr:iron-containing alcohol dehydrogenase [Defluviitaleaceae bacterium]MCL2262212.1 iron-containing alcohol dehydrogenase [Defluviitaleaceae bacterium]
MEIFQIQIPTNLVFGKGTQHQIGGLVKPLAKKVLLHYGGGTVKKLGLYDDTKKSLIAAGIDFVELGGVQPNPRLSLVYEGIELCKKEGVDFILAIGGGSTIDSAKAIAVGVCHDGDVWDIFDDKSQITAALPVATILTIPAAGSEMSVSAVVTNEEKGRKYGMSSDFIRPVISIVNPEFFTSLPKSQLGYGVADIMSHIFERYFTHTVNCDITDGLCESILKTVMKNAIVAAEDPTNYEAWAEIGLGGIIAHNNWLGIGRSQCWGCHGMEHELSAYNDVAHGAGLAVLTPAWMKYVYKENINMFVQFAVNVMGVQGSFRDPDAIILEGISRLQDFYKKIGLPQTLNELNIPESAFEDMAKKATGAFFGEEHGVGNFKRLKWQDVVEIYKLCK